MDALLSKEGLGSYRERLHSYESEGCLFRGEGSMRFHPNSRASTDH